MTHKIIISNITKDILATLHDEVYSKINNVYIDIFLCGGVSEVSIRDKIRKLLTTSGNYFRIMYPEDIFIEILNKNKESDLLTSKKLKRNLRAMIHKSIITKDYSNNDEIRGYISFIEFIEKGFKEKTINYINRLISKADYTFDLDIVNEFNKNKLYKDQIKDMRYNGDILENYEDAYDIISNINDEREEYLARQKVNSTRSPKSHKTTLPNIS